MKNKHQSSDVGGSEMPKDEKVFSDQFFLSQ